MTAQTDAPESAVGPRSGIDLSHRNAGIRPQDDLFAHVNGRWLAEHEIPADRAVDGAFRALFDQAEVDVAAIIREAADEPAPGPDTARIGALYRSFMDVERVEQAGCGPIADELSAIASAADKSALARLLGALQRVGVKGAVMAYVDTDAKNSERYLLHWTQSGLGLPDESYYRDEKFAGIRAEYAAHMARMFALAGLPDQCEQVLAVEAALAAGHWDVVRRRDANLSYNLLSIDSIRTDEPGFDWAQWLAGMGVEPGQAEEVIVRQPSYLSVFATAWSELPLSSWQAWLSWHVLRARAQYLSSAFVDESFAFTGTTMSGTERNRERWQRGVALVQELLGEAVGKLYVERHFPPAARAQMVRLVENLIEAYRRNISELEWMSPQTREAALVKLGKFTPKIGYPDTWRDYSGIQFEADDLVGNYRRGYAAEFDRDLAKLGGPVDRGEWFMTPQTVNAYYNPGMNEIVFPAAILQPPFFDMHADDAANYGGIGAVIGHEIGHGFDDQGAKYDGDGNLVDWWTDDDRAEFGVRTSKLIAQYDALEPAALPGHHVNGSFTIGENIGDLGGLSIAIAAYRIALDGKPAPVIDGLTGLQRVFYGWAQVWRTKVREAEAIRRLAVDPHSPPEFRCNAIVRNVDEFYTAFDVSEADALYMDTSDRVRIW